ncbi:MAG: hypothetical protein HYV97_01380 [Bdellovibrio sp.]|nr:hypothetical protein [Bdellovibrio sp.]
MNWLILAAFMACLSLSAQAFDLKMKCTAVMTSDGVSTTTFPDFILSSEGKNSHYMPFTMSWDRAAGVLVTLNRVGGLCSHGGCDSVIASRYNLTLTRMVDEIGLYEENKKGADERKPIGELTKTVRIAEFIDGRFEVKQLKGREYITSYGLDVEGLELNYTIKRKIPLERQKVKVSCQVN